MNWIKSSGFKRIHKDAKNVKKIELHLDLSEFFLFDVFLSGFHVYRCYKIRYQYEYFAQICSENL